MDGENIRCIVENPAEVDSAARVGCQVAMLTQNLDSVGQMSCNPAIGGQAKGQIVREIDALRRIALGRPFEAPNSGWNLL